MASDLDFSINADTSAAQRNIRALESSLNGLSNAFKVVTAAVSVTAIAQFSDSITNLQNRLRLLSDSQAEAATAFKAVAGIAISARTDLAATGDLYFRIARAADQLGISQREAAQITESVAKAISASGLSASESAGPLLQLGQALQSGTFQGDELRSILEGLPPVARALADSLGVPVGALKTLGSQGQITGEVFVQAMRAARDSIERDFANTIPTISGAFNNLKTTIGVAFSEFERTTNTGQNFALAIEYIAFQIYKLSKNIDEIIGPLTTFLQIIGTIAAVSVAGRVLSALGGIIMGLIRGIGMLGANVAMVWERFKQFGAVMAAAGGGLLAFAETAIFTLLPLGRLAKTLLAIGAGAAAFLGLDKVSDWFKNLGETNSESRNELEAFRKEMAGLKNELSTAASAPPPAFLDPAKMLKTRQELEQITIAYQRTNQELLKRLQFEGDLVGASEQQRAVKQALFDLENNYLQQISRLTDEYRQKSQSKNKEDQAALPIIQEQLAAVSEEYARQINLVASLTEKNYTLIEAEKQRQALSEFAIKSQLDGTKRLRDLQDEMAKMGMSEIEKKYYDIARSSEDSARAAIDSENSRRRSLKLAEMTADEEQKYYEAAARNNAKLIELQGQIYEQSRTFKTGWSEAFRSYADDATNAAKQAQAIFQKATQGMEDAIVNFAKTGKFEWKNFVNSMLEELLRSQIRQVFANLIPTFSSGGGGGGSFFGALGSLLGFANGGIIPTNRPVLVGERGPEILTGAGGRTVIPNDQLGSQTMVTYNINAVDASSFKALVSRDPAFIHAVAQQGASSLPRRR